MILFPDTVALSVPTLVMAAATIFVAGTLRGLTGFGFAIASVPLLSSFLEPRLAVATSVLLQLAFVVLDAPRAWTFAQQDVLPRLIVGALLATPIGMLALRVIAAGPQRLVIAAATVVALFVVWRGKEAHSVTMAARPGLVGFAAGLLNGLAGMPGPPVVMYFLTAHIPAMKARASLIVFFAATSMVAALTGAILGIIGTRAVFVSLIALPALVAGNRIGRALFHAGDAALYRRAGLALLAVAAFSAGWKGLSGYL